ncbi:MAG: hypothetical protein RPR97_00890 [Colwellia sp.]
MSDTQKNSSSELIKLLEVEMLTDIRDINVSAKDEQKVDFLLVHEWYVETEKLIRVIGNLFTVPLSQSINQLRYAGHHILKTSIDKNDSDRQKQNLIEAYKHCKRAYYDALDFYAYKLSEDYRVLLPYLDTQSASKLERSLREHLQEIQTGRLESKERIEYYYKVQKTVIKGLEVIESLNEIQRETGVSRKLYIGKKTLLEENSSLEKRLSILEVENKTLTQKLEGKLYGLSLTIAFLLAIGTAIGLIADAFLTSNHSVVIVNESNEKDIPSKNINIINKSITKKSS